VGAHKISLNSLISVIFINWLQISQFLNEEKLKKMEKERPDALEMAEKEKEEGKEKAP
jgi:hypothetical protein